MQELALNLKPIFGDRQSENMTKMLKGDSVTHENISVILHVRRM